MLLSIFHKYYIFVVVYIDIIKWFSKIKQRNKIQGDGENQDEDKHPAVIPSFKTCAQTY